MATSYDILDQERETPSVVPLANAVNWSIFRRRADAEHHIDRMRLSPGHQLIGGHSHDSITEYWWVGVAVESIGQWGSRQAINKHGRLGD
ncbi:MAG: hypothetical protein M0Z76_00310 [Gammaproteobacteria bacterium]|nr:hypothetical protein [Gammaproteobacteria bacterium]